MLKHLTISIPKPCHEDWSKMTPNEQGAFCSACQKLVIDFSLKTENEIYEVLSNTNGVVCGRFDELQLNRPIHKTELNNGWLRWKAVAVGLLAVLGINRLTAGTDTAHKLAKKVNDFAQDSVSSKPATVIMPVEEKKYNWTDKDTSIHIGGVVIDVETSKPVPFATVQLGKSSVGIVTDIDGNFSFVIKRTDATRYGNLLYVTALGYDKPSIHVNEFIIGGYQKIALTTQSDNVIMPDKKWSQSTHIMGGAMVVTYVRDGWGYYKIKRDMEKLKSTITGRTWLSK